MIAVDPQDQWLLDTYYWRINNGGYVIATVAPYTEAMLHHCIMGFPIWHEEEIDHEDRDKQNNRRSNLRWVTPSQQRVNRSLALGVTGERNILLERGKYRVRIKRNWKMNHIGVFDTLDEAIAARDAYLCQ